MRFSRVLWPLFLIGVLAAPSDARTLPGFTMVPFDPAAFKARVATPTCLTIGRFGQLLNNCSTAQSVTVSLPVDSNGISLRIFGVQLANNSTSCALLATGPAGVDEGRIPPKSFQKTGVQSVMSFLLCPPDNGSTFQVMCTLGPGDSINQLNFSSNDCKIP